MNLKLYSRDELNSIDWNKAQCPHTAKYLKALLLCQGKGLVANVETKVYLLESNRHLIPITVNNDEYENAFVCSPYTQNISYVKEELSLLKNPLAESFLQQGATAFGHFLKLHKINRVVSINNWLLTSNPPLELTQLEIQELSSFLAEIFPSHGLLLKALNLKEDERLFKLLTAASWHNLSSRQVFIFDGVEAGFLKKDPVKRDRKLFKKYSYKIVELKPQDLDRALELYCMLYLEKHSQYNPRYTNSFIKLCYESGVLKFLGLYNEEGRLDGVAGLFRQGTDVFNPFIGYDTSVDQNIGLYRMLCSAILDVAAEEQLVLNFSSGAAEFKRRRGGKPVFEYQSLFIKHLSAARKGSWQVLKFVSNNLAQPMMKRKNL